MVQKYTAQILRNVRNVPQFCGEFSKKFAINHSSVRNISMAILNFLIVDNVIHLSDGIQKLHCFPKHEDFNKIRTVHHNIKYGQREASLEAEMNYFLESDDLSTRMDSLAHLKNVLSDKKEELGVLYEKLQEIRGFSEECKTSIIHRLICSLAKLSCSSDEKVSVMFSIRAFIYLHLLYFIYIW